MKKKRFKQSHTVPFRWTKIVHVWLVRCFSTPCTIDRVGRRPLAALVVLKLRRGACVQPSGREYVIMPVLSFLAVDFLVRQLLCRMSRL